MSDQTRGAGRFGTAVLIALVLAACALAYTISSASAADGGSPQTVQQQQTPQPENRDRPQREDCPEKDGGGSPGSSSESELQF
jgi:hypothetical protein